MQKQSDMHILKVKKVTRELMFIEKYKLLPFVQNQLYDIKEALIMNNTNQSIRLMGQFINDYGTHIITGVELGASIEEYKFSNFNSLGTNISIDYDQDIGIWTKMLLQSNGNLKGKYIIRIYRIVHFQQIIPL